MAMLVVMTMGGKNVMPAYVGDNGDGGGAYGGGGDDGNGGNGYGGGGNDDDRGKEATTLHS